MIKALEMTIELVIVVTICIIIWKSARWALRPSITPEDDEDLRVTKEETSAL